MWASLRRQMKTQRLDFHRSNISYQDTKKPRPVSLQSRLSFYLFLISSKQALQTLSALGWSVAEPLIRYVSTSHWSLGFPHLLHLLSFMSLFLSVKGRNSVSAKERRNTYPELNIVYACGLPACLDASLCRLSDSSTNALAVAGSYGLGLASLFIKSITACCSVLGLGVRLTTRFFRLAISYRSP